MYYYYACLSSSKLDSFKKIKNSEKKECHVNFNQYIKENVLKSVLKYLLLTFL